MSRNHGQLIELNFDDLVAFIQGGLTDPYNVEGKVEYVHGPMQYDEAGDTLNEAVALTPGTGAGFTLEDTYDNEVWHVDIAGAQDDFDSAKLLTLMVDRRLTSVVSPTRIGKARVLKIVRTGGKPGVVGVDNGDRWHLAGSYLAPVESGI